MILLNEKDKKVIKKFKHFGLIRGLDFLYLRLHDFMTIQQTK